MDWKALKRDAAKVRAALAVQDDASVVATRALKIIVPERYVEKQLAKIGSETYVVGIYAMVLEDRYFAVSRINAMVPIAPTAINTIKIDEDSYLEFLFEPGAVVMPTTDLVVNDTLVYQIFDEFISKGRVPWYIGYDDLTQLFDTADRHANVGLGRQHAILAMVAAAITRSGQDRARFYRHTLKTPEDKLKDDRVVIPLRSITYGTTNTTSKLVGAYWNDGLTSALVNPSEKVEKIEELLRR